MWITLKVIHIFKSYPHFPKTACLLGFQPIYYQKTQSYPHNFQHFVDNFFYSYNLSTLFYYCFYVKYSLRSFFCFQNKQTYLLHLIYPENIPLALLPHIVLK